MVSFEDLLKFGAIIVILIIAANQLGVFKLIAESWNRAIANDIKFIQENWLSILIAIIIICVILYLVIHFEVISSLVDAIEGVKSGGP